MEEQGKRLLIAVAVAVAIVMAAWSFLFPTSPPEKDETKPGTTATNVSPKPVAPATGLAGTSSMADVATTRGPEKEILLASKEFRATFSTYGGALKSWELLGTQFYDGSPSRPEDLVRSPDEAKRPFLVSFPGSTHPVPPSAEWRVVSQSPTEVVFSHRLGALELTKTFTIYPADYLVVMTIDAEVEGGTARQNLVVSLGSVQDPAEVEEGGMASVGREWKAACVANGEVSTWSAKDLSGPGKEVGGSVEWFGFVYPYFLTALAIEPRQERVTCRATAPGAEPGPMLVEALFPPADLEPGKVYRRTVVGYMGPKYMGQLEKVAASVGWASTGFEKSIDLGWLGFLAGPLLWLLNFFYGLVENWPLSIVLLTLTVKLATLYWTHKSMKSMKAMAKLKPQLEQVKEKYKDDRQRQQVETMNLFKAHGVNPLAGCLPMVLQMPIWFALYKALSVAAELYQAEFLWIGDLTAADPYFILPVFTTGMMLVQALLTPTTATGAQQKMLSYGMPIIFGAMSLFFPAGLTLYISTNTILTLLHHLYMRAEDRRGTGPNADEMKGGKVGEMSEEADEGADEGVAVLARKGSSGNKRRTKGRSGRRRGRRTPRNAFLLLVRRAH